ncbi:rubredoxin [Prochlorococcus marinus]|uniref:rubredoxin n=1 Tax=Prochlorococcus marinus TaxID=1219 RepID=UPI0002F5EB2F|nr:rubredoxin [Prochlorococcus marinus]
MNYQCRDCIYIYKGENGDPIHGIPAGTKFEDLPLDWKCPICGAMKERFKSL